MTLGIRLAGPLEVTAGETRYSPGDFPGRQGRIVFAALAFAGRPVDRNELADILWPNRLPASWTRDLSAVVSKLRARFADVIEVTTGSGRWYALSFPAGARIDVADAAAAVAEAEEARAAGDDAHALRDAGTATTLLAEPFLSGDECAWIDERRSELRELLFRALVVRADVLCEAGRARPSRRRRRWSTWNPNESRPTSC